MRTGGAKLNALFADAHPDAVLLITDKVDAKADPRRTTIMGLGNPDF